MKSKILMLGFTLLMFAAVVPIWINSPYVKQENARITESVRWYLSKNYYAIDEAEKNFYMREYKLGDDDINPTKLLEKFKASKTDR